MRENSRTTQALIRLLKQTRLTGISSCFSYRLLRRRSLVTESKISITGPMKYPYYVPMDRGNHQDYRRLIETLCSYPFQHYESRAKRYHIILQFMLEYIYLPIASPLASRQLLSLHSVSLVVLRHSYVVTDQHVGTVCR